MGSAELTMQTLRLYLAFSLLLGAVIGCEDDSDCQQCTMPTAQDAGPADAEGDDEAEEKEDGDSDA